VNRQPQVLISVLNWNNAADTINCVRSIQKQDYKDYSIVVIDNASVDNSLFVLRKELSGIELIASKVNHGYAGGNRLGWEWGKDKGFELFWIVNNDAEVKPDCLAKLVEAYLKYGNNLYGGISLEPDNETISFAGGFEFDHSKTIDFKTYNKYSGKKISELKEGLTLREVGDVNGANMLIPAEIIKKYGYLDTRFFMYAEELDYCFKLRRDHNISSFLVPGAIVIHNASASFKKSPELKFIGIYYSFRNWHFFQLNHQWKKRIDLIRSEFSFLKLFITFVQSIIFGKNYFLKNVERTTSLAFLHAITGKSGKYYEPNEYL